MYFSSREQKIMTYLLDYRDGINVEKLQQLLGVSKRTVYREIASLEKTLQAREVKIIKPRGEGYRLVGDESELAQLKEFVSETQELILDNVQRQSVLTAQLLVANESLTVEHFADVFEVSQTTINNDLHTIEHILGEYQLSLVKVAGSQLSVQGAEVKRRSILMSLIYNEVTEYTFFNYLNHLQDPNQIVNGELYLLKVINASSLALAREIILTHSKKAFANVTDSQLQQIITILALSIDRMSQGNMIESEVAMIDVVLEMQGVTRDVLALVEAKTGLAITDNEQHFLANQLAGINYNVPQNIFLESYDVELSYHIREFIRLVSLKTAIDFRQDEALFYDLVAHLSAALKRNETVVYLDNNTLLENIIKEYRSIYQAVKESLKEVFVPLTFSQDEMAYLVIHFATSLEKHSHHRGLSALVLCSSGIGTGKILENRISTYIPAIDRVKVARLSEMKHLNFKEFDIILSTVFLPNFNLPYRMISPLLLDEEIRELKEFVKEKSALSPSESLVSTHVEPDFTDIYEKMRVANNVLEHFHVKGVTSAGSLTQTLFQIISELEGVIVSDAEKVTEAVMQRYQVAPIGVPKTNFALFHSANKWVKEPFFGVFDLDDSFSITSMDRKEIQLDRVLLMLAPEPMTTNEQTILGKISSSVIESDLNTEIYMHGAQPLIYQLLNALFISELKELN